VGYLRDLEMAQPSLAVGCDVVSLGFYYSNVIKFSQKSNVINSKIRLFI